MSSPATVAVRDDISMTEPGPRSGGHSARRSFTPEQKLNYLAGYETAIETNQGGAYLREHGLIPRRSPSGASSATAVLWPGNNPGR